MPVYTTSICTAPHIYNLAVNVLVVDMPVYRYEQGVNKFDFLKLFLSS